MGAFTAALGSRGADASEWRRAGSAPTSASAGVVQAQAHEPVQGGRSIMVRGGGKPAAPAAPVEFDPFEEPLNDDDAAMPAAEPTEAAVSAPATGMRPQTPDFDPFDADENGADAAIGAPPSDEANEDEADEEAESESFNIEQAFGEPRHRVAVGPSVEEAFEDSQNAAEEEMDRRDRRDEDSRAPAEEADEEFTTEDALDAPERNADEDLAGQFEPDDQSDDEEFDADDIEGQFQQAPGGFDIRPLDPQPGPTDEQAARRAELETQQIEAARIKSAETCEDFLAGVRADDIRTVSLAIRLEGRPGEDFPFDCGLGQEQFQPRSWAQTTYLWKASGLCHKPLYFEQVQMERYGHSWGPVLDPLVSGAHFFGSVPVLPYKMGLMTPNECVYTLGYYRPGSCAPFMIEAVPFTWRAAAFEAGAWTGGAFAIP